MNAERSRFVCDRCSHGYRRPVVCEGPICRRCTGICRIEAIDAAFEGLPSSAQYITAILAKATAQGRFRLSKGKS